MKVSQAERVGSELLSVELDQIGVPLLGELPHNFAGDFHFYKKETISQAASNSSSIFISFSVLTSA